MLRKMRWRFIAMAMFCFFTVVLILTAAINLWHYRLITGELDATLQSLANFDDRQTSPFSWDDSFRQRQFAALSPEANYMLRFFIVHYDEHGQLENVNQDYIASISFEDAQNYAAEVMEGKAGRGYYQGYRYLYQPSQQGAAILFLNAEKELQSAQTVLILSSVIAAGSLLAVFALVVAFSKRAIAPYIRNIETQKRFITDASHELKTPLTSIFASADILAMEEAGNEWVQNIQAQSARLSRLISNLVTLSRLDEEQPFPERSLFSLSEALWEIAEPFGALAQARGKQYEQDIEDGLSLYGDREAVQQMISLLLDNAVKYSGEGGRVSIALRKKKRKTELVVFNTCALPENYDLNRLFDRFYRQDISRSSDSGGYGIGLSIVKATAEAHDGKIQARAEDGGLSFTVTL